MGIYRRTTYLQEHICLVTHGKCAYAILLKRTILYWQHRLVCELAMLPFCLLQPPTFAGAFPVGGSMPSPLGASLCCTEFRDLGQTPGAPDHRIFVGWTGVSVARVGRVFDTGLPFVARGAYALHGGVPIADCECPALWITFVLPFPG